VAICIALVGTPADSWGSFTHLPSLVRRVTHRDIVKVIRSSELVLRISRLYSQSHIMHQHQVWEGLLAFQTLSVVVITTNHLELQTSTKVMMRT
jgi:hypothetical protein